MSGFAIGDVVQLKSGGPFMTVAQVADGAIGVTWFGQVNEKPLWEEFHPGVLKIVKP